MGEQVPMTVASGGLSECSALLNYSWLEDVLYTAEGSHPSAGKVKLGIWVGVAEKQGDTLTCLILTADTDHVIDVDTALHSSH
jgi:hypothetical protein